MENQPVSIPKAVVMFILGVLTIPFICLVCVVIFCHGVWEFFYVLGKTVIEAWIESRRE